MEPQDRNTNLAVGLPLFLICGYWLYQTIGIPHTVFDPPWVFLDFVNLIFHEAGHVIFMFFGDFLHVLGGSLTQLLIPLIALFAFIRQGEGIAAGFSLFWLGESANNVSYYIADARTQALPLLGGDPAGHDWTWLLTYTHHLESDTAIGNVVRAIGIIAMCCGLLWMAYSLFMKFYEF